MAELTEFARLAVRVKSTAFDEELNNLVEACLKDLKLAGAETVSADDNLTRQAVTLYLRAHFGSGFDDPDRYERDYQALKITMANSSDYGKGE